MSEHTSNNSIDEGLHRNSDAPLASTDATVAPNLRKAAVLLPLVYENNEWHLLFIRRADSKRDRHSGQVAFPGGAMEPADNNDPLTTALRETFEEIGVATELVTPLQSLTAYITISDFSVVPIVGVVTWPTTLTLQTNEVSRAFTIPVAWLRERSNFTLRPRSDFDKASTESKPTRPHPIVVYQEYDGEVLWGATARMTLNFLQALDSGELQLPAT